MSPAIRLHISNVVAVTYR